MSFEISILSFLACIATGYILSKTNAFSFLNNRDSRFDTLDGLRGFLALSVFFHHFATTYYWKVNGTWLMPPELVYQNYGTVGVSIFFMMTGFLFTLKLINSKWKTDWLKFFESRTFRIFPLYFFAVLFIVAIVFHNSNYQLNSPPHELIRQLLRWGIFHGISINNYEDTGRIIAGVDWTLKYEWLFYASLPAISIILSKGKKVINYLLCSLALVFFFQPIESDSLSSKYAILFLAGGVSAHIVVLGGSYTLPKIASKLTSLATLMLLAGIMLYPRAFDFIHIMMMFIFFTLIALGNDLFGVLRLNAARVLGEISYSAYLLHGLLLYILFTQLAILDITTLSANQYSLIMPITGVLVVLLSAITFLCIEKPFIEYGRQYNLSRLLRSISAKVKTLRGQA